MEARVLGEGGRVRQHPILQRPPCSGLVLRTAPGVGSVCARSLLRWEGAAGRGGAGGRCHLMRWRSRGRSGGQASPESESGLGEGRGADPRCRLPLRLGGRAPGLGQPAVGRPWAGPPRLSCQRPLPVCLGLGPRCERQGALCPAPVALRLPLRHRVTVKRASSGVPRVRPRGRRRARPLPLSSGGG